MIKRMYLRQITQVKARAFFEPFDSALLPCLQRPDGKIDPKWVGLWKINHISRCDWFWGLPFLLFRDYLLIIIETGESLAFARHDSGRSFGIFMALFLCWSIEINLSFLHLSPCRHENNAKRRKLVLESNRAGGSCKYPPVVCNSERFLVFMSNGDRRIITMIEWV